MSTNSVNAVKNPDLASELVKEALAEPEQDGPKEVKIQLPSDNSVDLPGGYISPEGEVYRTAEVRELTGKDEEAMSRATTIGKMLTVVLARGVVSVGGKPANEPLLDTLFAGDRDALLLGIYRATFGNTAELKGYCQGCNEFKDVEVDLLSDISFKMLTDPIAERNFTVQGRKHEYTVALPDGHVQKELNANTEKTIAELGSILLDSTVIAIDGTPVYSKTAVQNLGIQDRRKISEAIAERNPGPKFEDLTVTCPDCDTEVVVPISLGALFQF